MIPVREFVADATVYTVGMSDTGEPEAFVQKQQVAACPHCGTGHLLFLVHPNDYCCLLCARGETR